MALAEYRVTSKGEGEGWCVDFQGRQFHYPFRHDAIKAATDAARKAANDGHDATVVVITTFGNELRTYDSRTAPDMWDTL